MPAALPHLLPDILRARIFAIARGYEDADDLDRLRRDAAGGSRQRNGSVLAAHRLALGERAVVARPHPPNEGDGRSVLRQLPRPTSSSEDALGQRGAPPSASPRASHPQTLAAAT
jgi:hypothetical protein